MIEGITIKKGTYSHPVLRTIEPCTTLTYNNYQIRLDKDFRVIVYGGNKKDLIEHVRECEQWAFDADRVALFEYAIVYASSQSTKSQQGVINDD